MNARGGMTIPIYGTDQMLAPKNASIIADINGIADNNRPILYKNYPTGGI
jgi:hypothetical protein